MIPYTGAVSFFLGVILFALGIAVTIAVHEWGHMTAARMFGMRVRKFFVGFGPTVWSKTRRHEAAGGHDTEYGLKAIPLGGFCDIAGMAASDEVTEDEKPYAMYRQAWWKRVIVLSGGVIVNICMGIFLIYICAVAWGLPDLDRQADPTPQVLETACVSAECADGGPAAEAGIRAGDVITSIGGTPVDDYSVVPEVIQGAGHGELPITVDRDGQPMEFTVIPQETERVAEDGTTTTVTAVGVSVGQPAAENLRYNAVTAVPAAFGFTGQMLDAVWHGLLSVPEKIPGVIASIGGADRDPESPMSVVGASRVGGELVDNQLWPAFVLLLANLNFFLAFFNLIPLVPLDGGHIAVVLYEKVRDAIRRLFGKAPGGPADYQKLMPVSLAFTAALMLFGGILIAADVVNPIILFR